MPKTIEEAKRDVLFYVREEDEAAACDAMNEIVRATIRQIATIQQQKLVDLDPDVKAILYARLPELYI
jgi:hypothetical protein